MKRSSEIPNQTAVSEFRAYYPPARESASEISVAGYLTTDHRRWRRSQAMDVNRVGALCRHGASLTGRV
jgi:hypothetical protein